MAYKNNADALITNSKLFQMIVENADYILKDSNCEQDLRILHHLYKSLSPRVQRHACIQTTPQVEPADMPWVLDLEGKVDHLCVSLSNLLNSLYNSSWRSDDHVSVRPHQAKVGNAGNETSGSRFKTSKNAVEAASGFVSEINIQESLQEILKLAIEIRSKIPVLDYGTQPKNFQAGKKTIPRSLIPVSELAKPVDKRINGLISKNKMRRSNSVPDFFAAKSHQSKGPLLIKRQNAIEVTNKIAAAGHKIPKTESGIVQCAFCGQLIGRQENAPSSSKSKFVNNTGAIPKKQLPVRSTRARTASQSSQAISNRPRWK